MLAIGLKSITVMVTELTRDNLVKTTRPELRENIMENKPNTSDNGLTNADQTSSYRQQTLIKISF